MNSLVPSLLFLFFAQTFQCPIGSVQIPNENICLYPIVDTKAYNDANRKCAVYGGIPAKVQNVFENAFVGAMMTDNLIGNPTYIGVTRNGNNTWTYADGTPLTFQNWAPNEPSTAGNCTTIDSNGKWAASDCVKERAFFCTVDQNNFPCPNDWIYQKKTGYCYYFQDFTFYDRIHWQLYNWSISEINCQKMNSHLVSIHSDDENNFIYDLISSNVVYDYYAAPNSEPCYFQYAWIGYFGNGTLGTGQWSDGSKVDYNGGAAITENFYWAMANDDSCERKLWDNGPDEPISSRYVCKMAPNKK